MSTISTVRDILAQKNSREIWSIGPDATVFDAVRLMALHNVGALVVLEYGRVIGTITEREYARSIVLESRSSKTTRVREVMFNKVISVTPDDSTEGVLALMSQDRVRHVPVMEGEQLVGIISMGDVVRAIISDQDFMIDQLTCYITGSHSFPPSQGGGGRMWSRIIEVQQA